MCGLFGMASTVLTPQDKKIFYTLGVLSTFRGDHSTGLVSVKGLASKPEVKVHKEVVSPSEFFKSEHTKTVLGESGINLLIGHNRLATVGAINSLNAQPIISRPLFGTHNGTIRGLEDDELGTSDSIGLYIKINEEGLIPALKYAEEKYGAFALVWYDLSDDTLNFIRNDKRTLYIASNNGNVIWASESEFLEFAFKKHKAYTSLPIQSLEPNLHIKIKRTSLSTVVTRDLTEDIKRKVVWGKWPDHLHEQYGHYGYGRCHHINDNDQEKKPKPVSKKEKKAERAKLKTAQIPKGCAADTLKTVEEEAKKIAHRGTSQFLLPDAYMGYNNEMLGTYKAGHILEEGCSNCSNAAELTDAVFFFNSNEYLCETCKPEIVDSGAMHESQLTVGYPVFLNINKM